MVVDDNEDIRLTVKALLESSGYEVITAISGDDCLEKLKRARRHKPDLILMDIMMPGTPVKDVVRKIKGVKIAFLSVVVLSNLERDELLALEHIVDFIQKPFDIDELLRRVKKIVG